MARRRETPDAPSVDPVAFVLRRPFFPTPRSILLASQTGAEVAAVSEERPDFWIQLTADAPKQAPGLVATDVTIPRPMSERADVDSVSPAALDDRPTRRATTNDIAAACSRGPMQVRLRRGPRGRPEHG